MTDQERIDYFAAEVARLRRQLVYHRGRHAPKSTPSQLAACARYRASEKGHARTERYNASEARRDASARYNATAGAIIAKIRRRIGAARARLAALA